ncbi:glycosyltransferase, partial [Fulvivirga lutimaris]|uniref:glycosyltransferase n=1 Tax=Fulvivirga lutimaris TaxID=1819566 RepID=UPI0012BC552B
IKVIGKGSSNGIDTNHFQRSQEIILRAGEFRKDNEIPADAVVLCFVGRLVRDKGIEELVAAFKRLKMENNYLLLLGEYEDQREPLNSDTKNEIQHNKRILSMGFQSDIRMYLAASDIFVFPSYREGFPNALLQACAMGLPSIATNINGNNEIISPDENGLLVDVKNVDKLKEAIELLGTNKSLRNNLAAKARSSIMDYDQENVWRLILNEYNSLV